MTDHSGAISLLAAQMRERMVSMETELTGLKLDLDACEAAKDELQMSVELHAEAAEQNALDCLMWKARAEFMLSVANDMNRQPIGDWGEIMSVNVATVAHELEMANPYLADLVKTYLDEDEDGLERLEPQLDRVAELMHAVQRI